MNKYKGYSKMLFLAVLLGTFVTGGASAEIICIDTKRVLIIETEKEEWL